MRRRRFDLLDITDALHGVGGAFYHHNSGDGSNGCCQISRAIRPSHVDILHMNALLGRHFGHQSIGATVAIIRCHNDDEDYNNV